MKNHTLSIILFAFTLAALPVLAVDTATSTTTSTPVVVATSTATTSPRINPRNPRAMQAQMKNMEKRENKMEQKNQRQGNASSTVDVACAKAAIDVRGTAVLSAYNTHTATVAGLIASSTIGHKAAFDLTGNDRKKALRAINQALKMGRMKSQRTMMTAERNALTTFKTSMRACGVNDSEIDKGQPLVQ